MQRNPKAQKFNYKNMSKLDMVDYMNKNYPIKMKHVEELVNRVHARYDLIPKDQVAKIVKIFFTIMRDLMIMGKTLQVIKLFSSFKFLFVKYQKNGYSYPRISPRINIANSFRDIKWEEIKDDKV